LTKSRFFGIKYYLIRPSDASRKGITRMFNVLLSMADTVAWLFLALIVAEPAGRSLGQMAARIEWEWR
jgi:hypothetical protein